MSKILIVGNNAAGEKVYDGGCIKLRLYYSCLKKMNTQVSIFDLCNWKKKPVSTYLRLKKSVKEFDTIIIMAGPRGSRFLIPVINSFNKNRKKRVIYCPLGTGTIEKPTKSLNEQELIKFINCIDFFDIKDDKIKKELSLLSAVIPQNDTLANLYKNFYGLSNVYKINNFRDAEIIKRKFEKHHPIKSVFLSRVSKSKGIFLLLEAISKNPKISLDIYGDLQLNDTDKKLFFDIIRSNENVEYCGLSDYSNSIDLLSTYDLFFLPTQYKGEGTPGAFIESMIAGTPAIISSYSQSKELVANGKNGYIFEIGSSADLEEKINVFASLDKNKLDEMSEECQDRAQQFLFKNNMKSFFEIITGEIYENSDCNS